MVGAPSYNVVSTTKILVSKRLTVPSIDILWKDPA
jgi:hypothetical protein